jgi:hypothetical protein
VCAEAATVRAAEIQMAKERMEAQLKEQQQALQKEVEAHELQLAKCAPPCGSTCNLMRWQRHAHCHPTYDLFARRDER